MDGENFERDLIRAAWFEFKCNSAMRGGTGRYATCRRSHHRVSDGEVHRPSRDRFPIPHDTDLDEVRPPRWFVQDELGFALDAGPSISWTCRTLDRQNRLALRQLGRDAPKKVSYPFNFILDSRARRRPSKASYTSRLERGESLSQLLERALARFRRTP